MAKNPLNISLTGMNGFKDAFKTFEKTVVKEVGFEIQDASNQWAQLAKSAAPTDQGRLKGEITAKKKGELESETISQAAHSPYLEFGTLSKVRVPADLASYAAQFRGTGAKGQNAKRAIYAWMDRVGIPKERQWFLFISIITNGIRPQPFFFPQKPIVEKLLFANIKKIMDKPH